MPTYLYADGVARLGTARTGLAGVLGYRLVDANDATVQAWTKAGVEETEIAGTYRVVLGGVEGMPVPDGFVGTIYWEAEDGMGGYEPLASEELWPGKFEYVDVAISSRMPWNGTTPGAAFVDHDYPDPDSMRVTTSAGAPIPNASIMVFRRSDYDAGRRSRPYLAGYSGTGPNGRWTAPVPLGADDYAAVFTAVGYKPGLRYFTVG